MAKYLKKYKTREDFENDKTALIHDLPELEAVVGLIDDIEDIEVIKDDDRLIHAVYEFPEDIPEGSNPFCENSDIIKRFIIDGIEVNFETANNMPWAKGIHKVAFYIDDRCGDDTLNFQNNEFLSSIFFGENCALQKLPLFSYSSSLKSVNIRSTRFESIEDYAFRDCSSLTSINIPESVTSIGFAAFYYCTGLTSIKIPEGVIGIGMYAFENCSSLVSIIIPGSVKSIGSSAFYKCTGLTSITIPDSVTSIGRQAFEYCSGELTVNCNISSASTAIYGAFYKSNFTKVTIGEEVTSIGSYAFCGCDNLTSITCFAIPAPTINYLAFRDIASKGVLKYPKGSNYSSWMSTDDYYLGYYNWTSQEIEV